MNRAERRRQGKKAGKANLVPAALPPLGQSARADEHALKLAKQHHAAGRLAEAERIYQQILRADPAQPVALHLLGVIAHQVGKFDLAIDRIEKALALAPDYAEAHNNLGVVFKQLGRLDEATECYRKALVIAPDYADAHNGLGVALKGLGKLDEAVASYHKALTAKSDHAEAHNNLGNV